MACSADDDDGLASLLAQRDKTIKTQFCSGCPIRSRTCGAKGPADSPVVFVGESPGAHEVRQNKPFVGESGQLLAHVMREVGLDVEPFVTNAFSCLPPQGDGKSKDKILNDACRSCRSRLVAEISAHPRRLIIAMGNAAVRSLTENWSFTITKGRGNVVASDLAELGILPTFHPAHILRNEGLMPQFKVDLAKAASMLAGEKPLELALRREIVTTKRQLRQLARELVTAGNAVADIESTGLDRQKDWLLCVGIAPWSFKRSFEEVLADLPVVRIITNLRDYMRLHRYIHALKFNYTFRHASNATRNRLRGSAREFDVRWIWHNGKFDISFLQARGVPRRMAVVHEDTMLMSYTLDENTGRHGLEQCIADHLGLPGYKDKLTEYVGTGKKKLPYSLVPKPVLYEYLNEDVLFTGLLAHKLRPQVFADVDMAKQYRDLLIPASNTLAQIELNGMAVSEKNAVEAEQTWLAEMAPLVDEMRQLAGQDWIDLAKPPKAAKGVMPEFNPNSHLQVMRVLKARGVKAKSSGKEVLAEFRDSDDFVDALLSYRERQKLVSTYIVPLREIAAAGERAYTTYQLHTTVTGRLSSSPNRQNIPKVTAIKNIVVAAPGRILMSLDYSQAELRSLAVLSGDDVLLGIFKSGRDLHDEVATAMFGPGFNSYQRRAAKTVNFGIVYGITAKALHKRLNCTIEQAQDFIDMWLGRFAKASAYIKRCRDIADLGNYNLPNAEFIKTPYGRRRRFHLITNQNRHSLENQAGNHPHQSMCSDFCLDASIRIDRIMSGEIRWAKYNRDVEIARTARPQQINIVHDDNIFEMDFNRTAIYHFARFAQAVMINTPIRKGVTEIPFNVEPAIGLQWGELKETSIGALKRWAYGRAGA